jgi:hypothetical protein
MHAIDPTALAAPAGATRRPWRWVAAAGGFALLLCATVATTAFVHRPTVAVPSTTFAPAPELQLDSAAVATARDQAPPVAVGPKKPPAHAITPTPSPKINPRARPSTVERPSPRPRPAARPLRQPAPKKCKNLGCL